jgi:hypothetical protein
MSSKPKKDGPSWQAQAAFYLSLALAAFQLFQFVHSGWEATTAASIDIGKKYISDVEVMRGRYIAIRIAKNEMAPATLIASDVDAWNQFILNISYIAELLQKGRLDRAYLTDMIACDIWLASFVATKLPNPGDGTGALQKVGPTLEKDCKPTFPH